ncbi:hypothetical protein SAMN05216502_11292 [Citrobacter amalonaticus]|uniref:Uncharacterized protein n=1 Tax=Citrobacter amalonaticus TaxID=35703 RepID=A0A6N2WMJ1_CITAM|nr:hypothetical protein AF41_01434 [Citrobacter sp. MGH 55]OUE58485.1 hypothetical protein AZ012_002740 [Citrobacter amalonaticus]SFB28541.1 hypothetical protein SAMN05216502_11292 [Citrobacter amalonaticus]
MIKSKAFPGSDLYTVSQTMLPCGAAIFLNSLTKRGE